jgi:hypothetical protein
MQQEWMNQVVATLPHYILQMQFLIVQVMVKGPSRRWKLLCKIRMEMESISVGTNSKVSFKSHPWVLTWDGGNYGTIILLVNPFSIPVWVVIGGLHFPGNLLLLVVFIIPRERGKLNRGSTYYDFLVRHTSPATLLAPSQAPS